ncbi:hypothetical protein [Ottowia sp.]|uniref:hypothetical protein n=1 Tax=Ottowia sp. TaxID=1898956 RepID=UPI0025F044DF|nr:hypothetical protein [Ottowia sp.]MBK6616613.1 hypothetical protein [Ottowia sp.]
MDVTQVWKFVTPCCCVEFFPVADVPGYSHKVVIDGKAGSFWLSSKERPNKKSAVFFARVFAALRDGLPKYHYVDRREDPPVLAGVQQVVAGADA